MKLKQKLTALFIGIACVAGTIGTVSIIEKKNSEPVSAAVTNGKFRFNILTDSDNWLADSVKTIIQYKNDVRVALGCPSDFTAASTKNSNYTKIKIGTEDWYWTTLEMDSRSNFETNNMHVGRGNSASDFWNPIYNWDSWTQFAANYYDNTLKITGSVSGFSRTGYGWWNKICTHTGLDHSTVGYEFVNVGQSPSNPSSISGYTFEGWYTDSDCTQSWNKDNQHTDVNLYAKYTASTTNVTLDRQGGTTGSTSVVATLDSDMPSITVPSKTGYTFGGYFTATGGGGTQYYNADGSSAKKWDKTDSAYTLYAKWTGKPTTVTLNQADATKKGTEQVTATYGSAMPALTSIPEKTGYAFVGFYKNTTQYYTADGKSAKNWDIDSATESLDVKWDTGIDIYFTDNYAWSGHYVHFTGGSSETTFPGIKMTYAYTNTESTHQWVYKATIPSGTTSIVFSNGNDSCKTTTISSDIAQDSGWYVSGSSSPYGTGHWTVGHATIKYNLDGGSGTASDLATYTNCYKQEVHDGTGLSKTGYTFGGWTYNDTPVTYENNKYYFTTSSDTEYTLKAIWTPNTYSITYKDCSSVEGGAAYSGSNESSLPKTHTYGTATALTDGAKTGYTFEGWFKNYQGSGSPITSVPANTDSNITLFARWGLRYSIVVENGEGSHQHFFNYNAETGYTLSNTISILPGDTIRIFDQTSSEYDCVGVDGTSEGVWTESSGIITAGGTSAYYTITFSEHAGTSSDKHYLKFTYNPTVDDEYYVFIGHTMYAMESYEDPDDPSATKFKATVSNTTVGQTIVYKSNKTQTNLVTTREKNSNEYPKDGKSRTVRISGTHDFILTVNGSGNSATFSSFVTGLPDDDYYFIIDDTTAHTAKTVKVSLSDGTSMSLENYTMNKGEIISMYAGTTDSYFTFADGKVSYSGTQTTGFSQNSNHDAVCEDTGTYNFKWTNSEGNKLEITDGTGAAQQDAINFAKSFNTHFKTICEVTVVQGYTQALEDGWGHHAEMFSGLSSAAKAYFYVGQTQSDISACIARYTYILVKYNPGHPTTITDFMGLYTNDQHELVLPYTLESSLKITSLENSTNIVTIIIVSTSLLALSSLATVLILKKKKKEK